ncbi:MAG TPA: ferritin-like domain-containing protein [Mycobacteriales bacterium]|nr:ferritin-like domain-containing protein [Mycobacteriales bacterium]
MLTADLLTCGDLTTLTTTSAELGGPAVAIEDVRFPPETKVVAPRDVPKRSPRTLEGRVALIHAVAHIELSAVLLAIDHAHRFHAGMPAEYAGDWLRVAAEEAHHFRLLNARLQDLGARYGDLPVHDGQWATAVRTAHDPLARMALVPRVNEARGVDVTPGIRDALLEAGDDETAAVLDVILRDEIGHVAVGDRWFRHLCGDRDPAAVFRALLDEHGVRVRPPLNYEGRIAGGFSPDELDALTSVR